MCTNSHQKCYAFYNAMVFELQWEKKVEQKVFAGFFSAVLWDFMGHTFWWWLPSYVVMWFYRPHILMMASFRHVGWLILLTWCEIGLDLWLSWLHSWSGTLTYPCHWSKLSSRFRPQIAIKNVMRFIMPCFLSSWRIFFLNHRGTITSNWWQKKSWPKSVCNFLNVYTANTTLVYYGDI